MKPINLHKAYHAHVYFDGDSEAMASELCCNAGTKFGLKVGRFHKKLVGPHPRWSCQITFSNAQFSTFIPWLDENRHGLTILVHAITGDELKDHTEFAYWLGESAELNLEIFSA